jgi:hypothetical protein
MYKNVANLCSVVLMQLNRKLNYSNIYRTASIKYAAQPASLPLSPIHQ